MRRTVMRLFLLPYIIPAAAAFAADPPADSDEENVQEVTVTKLEDTDDDQCGNAWPAGRGPAGTDPDIDGVWVVDKCTKMSKGKMRVVNEGALGVLKIQTDADVAKYAIDVADHALHHDVSAHASGNAVTVGSSRSDGPPTVAAFDSRYGNLPVLRGVNDAYGLRGALIGGSLPRDISPGAPDRNDSGAPPATTPPKPPAKTIDLNEEAKKRGW